MIATGRVEEPELAEPVRALREAGVRTELLSIKPGQIRAVQHDLQPPQTMAADKTLDQADPGDCDALLRPGLARGRTLTSHRTLQNDLRNAGATWVNREVVVHGNLMTGWPPGDIPAFNGELLNLFAAAGGA